MNQISRPMWIAIALVVAMGLLIDSAKKTGDRAWRPKLSLFGMRGLDDDNDAITRLGRRPRSTEETDAANRARSRLNSARMSGQTTGQLAGLDANKSTAPVKAPPSESTEPANAAMPVNQNLGDPAMVEAKPEVHKPEDKKKKKKKKKKTGLPTADTQGPKLEVNSVDTSAETSSGGSRPTSAANSGNDSFGNGGGARVDAMVEDPKTLDEWLSYILREPSYERTMKFIKGAQNGSVTSEIFQEVVKQMSLDPRPQMHGLAIVALGSTPSTRSFLMLQSAAVSMPETSELRIQARSFLKQYSRLENLRYLIAALTGTSDRESRLEALRLIRASAEQYLRPTRPGTPTESGTKPPPVQITRQFNPLVPILERVVQTSQAAQDTGVHDEASSTLKRLETLLGTNVAANL